MFKIGSCHGYSQQILYMRGAIFVLMYYFIIIIIQGFFLWGGANLEKSFGLKN